MQESLDTLLARERAAQEFRLHHLDGENPGGSRAPARRPPEYVDVAQLLAGGLDVPVPSIGNRSDGAALLYESAVNVIFGPPETGKTLAASCIAADVVFGGGRVLWLDLDHNGAGPTISRMRGLGMSAAKLSDRAWFRLAQPDESEGFAAIVEDAATWLPTLVVVDSLGELLPLFGANSNDADDFSRVNRQTLAKLAALGSCVVAIDHEAKGVESRNYGSTGTAAKKRAVDGAMLRCGLVTGFVPGAGGKAELRIVKDRHGGLRAATASGDREPIAATFELAGEAGATIWKFWAPQHHVGTPASVSDEEQIARLSPPASSYRDVKTRLHWGDARARSAWSALRDRDAPLHPS